MEKHAKSEQKKTGASNLEFNLFSEVHELLRANAALERYMEDAREAGERDVEACFKEIHDQNKEHAGKLKEMLTKHLSKAS